MPHPVNINISYISERFLNLQYSQICQLYDPFIQRFAFSEEETYDTVGFVLCAEGLIKDDSMRIMLIKCKTV